MLDLVCGRAAGAMVLAEEIGLQVDGVEYAGDVVRDGADIVKSTKLAGQINVLQGDAEALPLRSSQYDAVICECSLCLFPNKEKALKEAYRVMKPGGSLGIADVIREPVEMPVELQSVESYVSCVGAALPLEEYMALIRQAGFLDVRWDDHRVDLTAFLDNIHQKLKGARILAALGKLPEPFRQVEKVVDVLKVALACVQDGRIGYVFITATKPLVTIT